MRVVLRRLRAWFLAGLLVVVPIGVTDVHAFVEGSNRSTVSSARSPILPPST